MNDDAAVYVADVCQRAAGIAEIRQQRLLDRIHKMLHEMNESIGCNLLRGSRPSRNPPLGHQNTDSLPVPKGDFNLAVVHRSTHLSWNYILLDVAA